MNTKTKYIGLAVLALACAIPAAADPVKIQWDQNPEPDIAEYRLFKQVDGADPELVPTTQIKAVDDGKPVVQTTIDLKGGEKLYVIAVNTTGLTSPPSETLTIPGAPSKPKGPVVIELQQSSNMKEWEPLAQHYQKGEGVKFYRLKVVTP